MAAPDLTTFVGATRLKNPLICGAGEHVMLEDGLRAGLNAGAGAVIVKSINETTAGKEQLQRTDYTLLNAIWREQPWDFSPPEGASLLCRSGLAQQSFEDWLDLVVRMDGEAQAQDAYAIASLIPADINHGLNLARRIEEAGVRILEVNIGAPHGEEAIKGAILLERDAARVRKITAAFRKAVKIPIWIKLTGQSSAIDALATSARAGGADAVTIMGRLMGFLPDIETQAPMLGTRGAIGGPWALPLTCHWIAKAREKMGPGAPIIATNGARTGLDIARFMLAGACAVQMTSAIFTGGFPVITECLREFTDYLIDKKMNARDLIGVAADRITAYEAQELRPDHWKTFLPDAGI